MLSINGRYIQVSVSLLFPSISDVKKMAYFRFLYSLQFKQRNQHHEIQPQKIAGVPQCHPQT